MGSQRVGRYLAAKQQHIGSAMGFPNGSTDKKSACNAGDTRDTGSFSRSGKSPGVGNGNTSAFLPEKFHGQRSLVGYSPMGCKESDLTEWQSRAQHMAPLRPTTYRVRRLFSKMHSVHWNNSHYMALGPQTQKTNVWAPRCTHWFAPLIITIASLRLLVSTTLSFAGI